MLVHCHITQSGYLIATVNDQEFDPTADDQFWSKFVGDAYAQFDGQKTDTIAIEVPDELGERLCNNDFLDGYAAWSEVWNCLPLDQMTKLLYWME